MFGTIQNSHPAQRAALLALILNPGVLFFGICGTLNKQDFPACLHPRMPCFHQQTLRQPSLPIPEPAPSMQVIASEIPITLIRPLIAETDLPIRKRS
jgi:hypothetical protein